jgi:hypothetical protein
VLPIVPLFLGFIVLQAVGLELLYPKAGSAVNHRRGQLVKREKARKGKNLAWPECHYMTGIRRKLNIKKF